MRLFPGDDVAGLSAFAEEMRAPWIIPPAFPRSHRQRLAVLVGRAVRTFDPRIRFVELRWADRWLLDQGTLHLPPRVLVWWRVSSIPSAPAEVLVEAPRRVPGHHLFDFETDPGVSSLGWMGPLKVRLLEKITEVLVDEKPLGERDVEPVLDALDDAAKTVESPIDLLDFAERLVAQYASGMSLSEARADAVARVIAARFGVGAAAYSNVTQAMAALGEAHRGDSLSAGARELLRAAGLAEEGTDASSPWMAWVRQPGVLERIEQELRLGRSSDPPPPLRVHAEKEAVAAAPTPDLSPVEAAAEEVLRDLRAGADLRWDAGKKWKAASALLALAGQLDEERGESLEPSVLERIAVLFDTAGKLAADFQPAPAMDALIAAASRYEWAHELDRAGDALGRALELAEGSKDNLPRARALLAKGQLALWMHDLAAARDAYDAALPLFRDIGDRLGQASVLRSRGDLASRMSDLAAARDAYDAALLLFRDAGDRLGQANVLQSKGHLASRMSDLAAARDAYDAALLLFRDAGDRLGQANVLRSKGDLALRMSDLAAAKGAYDAALPLYRDIGARLGQANVLQSKGHLALRSSDLAAAKDAYDAALPLYRDIGARLGQANVLFSKGNLALRMGDLAAARDAYDAALPFYGDIGDRLGQANVLRAKGELALQAGNPAAARESLVAARLLYEEIGDRLGEANSLRGLGVIAALEHRGASDDLRASAEVAEAIQDSAGKWCSLVVLASASGGPLTVFDDAHTFFDSAGLRWQATLVEALRHAVSGDVGRAAEALRACPGGDPSAEEIAALPPAEAVHRLMVLLLIA